MMGEKRDVSGKMTGKNQISEMSKMSETSKVSETSEMSEMSEKSELSLRDEQDQCARTVYARVGSPAASTRERKGVASWRELNARLVVTTSPAFGGMRYPLHQPLSSSASLSGRARDQSGWKQEEMCIFRKRVG